MPTDPPTYLGHGRLGVGKEELGAVADDAAVLLADPGEEARHVDEGHEGDVEGVGEAHEARGLDRGVDVQAARQVRGVVGLPPQKSEGLG